MRQMLVEDLDVVADEFLGSERIQTTADRIDGPRDLFGRPVLGPLEQHMLDEMRNSSFFERLFARPRADPNADGNAAHVRHLFGDDSNAVGEHGSLNVADFVGAPAAAGHGYLHPYCTATFYSD